MLRAIARGWVLHLTLLTLAALFVFPFLWMLGMSLKTDDEATDTSLFPAIPAFRERSPFVRAAADVERPDPAPRELWRGIYPELLAEAGRALEAVSLPAGTWPEDAAELREAAAKEATRRALSRIERVRWANRDEPGIRAGFDAALGQLPLADILQECLGRVELSGLQVRTLSGHVQNLSNPGQWRLVSGPGELLATGPETQVLRYRFGSASDQPIILQAELATDISPEDLHRLLVSLRGDASWHRFDAAVTLGGRRYTSAESFYLAQHRPTSILLQPPTFQDETLGPRNWIPMQPVSSQPVSSQVADSHSGGTLTLTLTPSSTPRAIYGKLQRNYARAFRAVPFWTYVLNSVLLVVLQLGGALFSSAFVGYAFARLKWPGRGLALGVLLATMMLPGQVTMVPTFLIYRSLGWFNTLNPLWVGAWLGNAFFIFLMIQHMRTIPRELDEAAHIDGLNSFQTWWYIIVPQVRPTLAAIAILTFMGAWNDFMGPLILLRDQTKFPLSLGLFSMRLDAGGDWPLIMAGNLLMTAPVILIFFLFQRYFVEGVTVSGMKG